MNLIDVKKQSVKSNK